METTQSIPVSNAARWTGWIMSILPCLLLLFSASMKLTVPLMNEKMLAAMKEGFGHMGLSLDLALGLGLLELGCTLVYLLPRTTVLGAILLTGYLGGAILCHLRVGDPYYTQVLLGVVLWGGLYLRDPRLRALIPLRS